MRRRATEARVSRGSSFVETALRGVEWLGRRSGSVRGDAYTLYAKNARVTGNTASGGDVGRNLFQRRSAEAVQQ
jgi:hypothetical protein